MCTNKNNANWTDEELRNWSDEELRNWSDEELNEAKKEWDEALNNLSEGKR